MNALEGTTVSLIEQFLDDDDEPLYPSTTKGGPRVRLYDSERAIIAEVIAVPEPSEIGAWRADLPIPNMGLSDRIELTARWLMVTDDGDRVTAKNTVYVDPQTERRSDDLIVIVGRDMKMQLTLPFPYSPGSPERKADVVNGVPARKAIPGDELTFSLYFNNQAIYENLGADDRSVRIENAATKTLASIPAVTGDPKVAPMSLLVSHTKHDAFSPTVYTFKVWAVTPQVLLAARQLEDFVNKAKIANVIPELEYSQADLLECLHRGLSMFNMLQPLVTNFTGTNMQGPLLSAWLTCAAYFALGAQIQAEGALAFDFGGQSVSLNVDRTPALESALSRLDSEIENQVKPFKKLLVRAGVTQGDGSQGGQYIDGSRALGTLGLTNAPTTRLPWAGARGSWFRNFF